MTKTSPGHAVYSGLTHPFTLGEDAEPGEFATLEDGEAVVADGEANAIGVFSDQIAGYDEGDLGDVHLTGVVIAAVDEGTAEGDEVLDKFDALSDEGASYRMHDTVDKSLDDGYAAVHLR